MKRNHLRLSLFLETIKENIWIGIAAAVGLVIIYALYFNTVSDRHRIERGYVIATFNQPSKYQPPAIIITVELLNGRIVTVTLPQGDVPPARGQEVVVKISKRQILGDSFSLVR